MRGSIWIISGLYYPEETSTGYILTKIAESLADQFEVNVLCGPGNYSGNSAATADFEFNNGVRIERCGFGGFNKNGILTRILREVVVSAVLFLRAFVRIKRDDQVLVVTNPVPLLWMIAIVCRIRGARLTISVLDVFPENLAAAGLLRHESILFKLLFWSMRMPYALAKNVVVLGQDMKEVVARKSPGLEDKITIIPNWSDCDEVRPSPRTGNSIIERLGLADLFIVQFAGNLGRVQGLECVIEAAGILKDEPIQFLFIGNGEREGFVKEKVLSEHNVTLLESMRRSEQPHFLNACDVGLVSLAPGMYGLGVPSKTYNIMAAGKPVIAVVEENSEIGRLVREEGVGWVVAPGDAQGLARAILEAKSDPEKLSQMSARARRISETRYPFVHVARAYLNLFGAPTDFAGVRAGRCR